jgi:hypothetical protein
MDIELVIYGSWDFTSSNQESWAIAHGSPFGVTKDFIPLAEASATKGFSAEAAHFAQFSDTLRKVLEPPENRLKSLSVLTHSDGQTLWMKGWLNANPPRFDQPGGILTPKDIKERLPKFINEDKLLPSAKVTLYACNAGGRVGVPGDLLKAFAQAFGVECRGFTNALQVCVKIKDNKITKRGWIRIDDGRKPIPCGETKKGYVTDLRELKPDVIVAPK